MNDEEINAELLHTQQVIKELQRRERILDVQIAKKGTNTAPETLIELEDVRARISQERTKIIDLQTALGIVPISDAITPLENRQVAGAVQPREINASPDYAALSNNEQTQNSFSVAGKYLATLKAAFTKSSHRTGIFLQNYIEMAHAFSKNIFNSLINTLYYLMLVLFFLYAAASVSFAIVISYSHIQEKDIKNTDLLFFIIVLLIVSSVISVIISILCITMRNLKSDINSLRSRLEFISITPEIRNYENELNKNSNANLFERISTDWPGVLERANRKPYAAYLSEFHPLRVEEYKLVLAYRNKLLHNELVTSSQGTLISLSMIKNYLLKLFPELHKITFYYIPIDDIESPIEHWLE